MHLDGLNDCVTHIGSGLSTSLCRAIMGATKRQGAREDPRRLIVIGLGKSTPVQHLGLTS